MSIRRVFLWLEMLLFPPACRYCGQRLSIFKEPLPQPLCPDCVALWARESKKVCPTCGKAYSLCLCAPKALQDAGCDTLVKRAVYHARRKTVVSRMLLHIKDVNDGDAVRFIADDLVLPTFRALAQHSIGAEHTVITYVPRRKVTARRTGHDQAKLLSKTLAKRLGIGHVKAIHRTSDGREQKRLTLAERQDNASCHFALSPRVDLTGRTVLLLDDICTTGASLASCTELLYQGGAERVVAVCVAVTQRDESMDR